MRSFPQILIALLVFTVSSLSYANCAGPATVFPCDADGDLDVDMQDIQAISLAKGTPSTGFDDMRDFDGDGVITVLDARQCVALCDEEQCAEPNIDIPKIGTLKLAVSTPDEALALIEVRSISDPDQAKVIVHHADDLLHEFDLNVGDYRVTPRPLYSGGLRYVAEIQSFVVEVRPGSTTDGDVTYVVSKGVQNLVVTDVSENSVSLEWDAEQGDDSFVRRVEGDEAAFLPSQGIDIPITDSSLIDINLKPGTTYTYSIFARPGDGPAGLEMDDPVTITVGTIPATGAIGVPTFVIDPRTKILAEDDYVSATPTGSGVRLNFELGSDIPPVGSFLVLLVSEELPGGYIGEVINVSDDGTSVWLVPAPMASAIDLYRLHVPSYGNAVSGATSNELALKEPTLNTAVAHESVVSKQELHKSYRDQARVEASIIVADDAETGSQSGLSKAANEISEAGAGLCKVTTGLSITANYDLDHTGHADVSLNTYDSWVGDIPSGFSFDYGYILYMETMTDIDAGFGLACDVELPGFTQQLSAYPVPILIKAEPKLGVEIGGLTALSGFSYNKTVGFRTHGDLDVDYGDVAVDGTIDGEVINEESQIEPFYSSFNSSIDLIAGGTVEFGPGVGTTNAGVLAGVGGKFIFANAGLKGDSLCAEVRLKSEFGIYATVEAWIEAGFLEGELEKVYDIEQLQATVPWFGSPWSFPEGCTVDDGQDPTDDVIGEGLIVVESDLSGLSDQWDKIDGFVPGEETWVLSSGNVTDAVGAPSFFASTNLGQPGNQQLSDLSGNSTFDAVSYNATLIPSGDTLHVSYVFASEEYPEYVGVQYNDVMAIYVNGQNCAFVPGTSLPVAVNTINHETNSQYYVDNEFGGSGYGTSMDGLTVPLTCSVPVTPGVPFTLKISIADASDAIYDSAIALPDGGIWSD